MLERKKLVADISKDTRDDSTVARVIAFLTPLAPVAVAAGTLIFSVRKAAQDRAEQRGKDEAQNVREAEDRRDQREKEERARIDSENTRFDERFADTVKNLASANEGEKRGAAAVLSSIVREKRDDLSDQAVMLLVSSLQVDHDEVSARLLAHALRDLMRTSPGRFRAAPGQEPEVSLAHLRIEKFTLAGRIASASGPDLRGFDIAFCQLPDCDLSRCILDNSKAYGASLQRANLFKTRLMGARWQEANCAGADFRRTRLDEARLVHANLTECDFFLADLSHADLSHANVTDARFHSTNLTATNFRGATVSEKTIASLAKANWREAHFDPPVRVLIEEASSD